jgi:hypothetical protein
MKLLKLLLWLLVTASFVAIPALGLSANDVIVDPNFTKAAQKKVLIDPLSVRPLYLIQVNGNQVLGMATGFVVQKANNYYLITNWHVLSGRHPSSDEVLDPTCKTPDALQIWHHGKQIGSWVRKKERLYDKTGNKRWLEHTKGRAVDVVALPLEVLADDIQLYPFNLSLADVDMVPQVAMPVSIIGFPVGFTSAGFFPIWKTGHIASEPNLDFHGEPLLLIDATTRGGMSGSPVVLRLSGGYKTKDGTTVMSASGYRTLFLGVYSGRLPGDSEIGRVWRPRLINEILP